MSAEDARQLLLRAFAATGEVPRDWLALIDLATAPPPTAPETARDPSRR